MEENREARAIALVAAVLAKRNGDRYVEGDEATVERAKRYEQYLRTGR